ncbi:MAG: hypothetical protein ACXV3D_02110 [Halobacteriota archaeon]
MPVAHRLCIFPTRHLCPHQPLVSPTAALISHPPSSWGVNRLDVFFVDTSGHLQQKYFDNGWKPPYNVGRSTYLSASPSAITWTYGSTTRYDILNRGDDIYSRIALRECFQASLTSYSKV